MALITKAPRGTQDVLPSSSYKWQLVERAALLTAALFGYKEIRVPTFEHTELFTRSVGTDTDVVQKEMYTFIDKGERSITLRPEGTAGVARAVVENGLLGDAMPLKLCYVLSCFRYEKPQAGRFRELHQFGVECFGAPSPAADAEVILLGDALLKRLNIKNITLKINSIGCPECRPNYKAALTAYFEERSNDLCETCRGRLSTNPMRILDCKSPVCGEIAAGAPKYLDYICPSCTEHFEGVKERLTAANIAYEVDPFIVRGLDYYTKTVFEFVSSDLGAQSTVCGGGRYDKLIDEIGGNDTCGLGFGMGLERLIMIMEKQGLFDGITPDPLTLYIAAIGEKPAVKAFSLCSELRGRGIRCECDIVSRSVKAQMKYADKQGALYTVVLGDDELAAGQVKLKCMATGETRQVALSELGCSL